MGFRYVESPMEDILGAEQFEWGYDETTQTCWEYEILFLYHNFIWIWFDMVQILQLNLLCSHFSL